MALKITAPVYTSKGIINECYIRINAYNLDKMHGTINVDLGIYANKEAADSAKPSEIGLSPIMQKDHIVITQMFSQVMSFSQQKEIQRERQVDRGTKGIETVVDTVKVVDFSEFHAVPDSFAFLYEKVKAKLVEIFGQNNVVNI